MDRRVNIGFGGAHHQKLFITHLWRPQQRKCNEHFSCEIRVFILPGCLYILCQFDLCHLSYC